MKQELTPIAIDVAKTVFHLVGVDTTGTIGLPDGNKAFHEWLGDSEEDLREAFFDGVAQGREKARDVKVYNAIMMKVAYNIVSTPCDEPSAQQNTLNELWKAIRESEHAKDWLTWPNPEDMEWPFP